MKSSIKIILFFLLGLFTALFSLLPDFLLNDQLSNYSLYILMFLVGIAIGGDKESLKIIKKMNFKIVLIPLSVIVGTLFGSALISFMIDGVNVYDSMAIGAGFGYYSLSSVFIGNIRGETFGVIALISNILREIFTLVATPFILKNFGKLAPIACGGATAMDTTLPIITKFSGKEYSILAVFSGTVLTALVPFIITFILS